MYALWKFFSLRWAKSHGAAEKAIDTPSRTFIEIATNPTTTSPLPITNYGWILSVLFVVVWMAVLSFTSTVNFSSHLTMKISMERFRNQAKRLEEQVEYLERTHEKTNDSLTRTQNELLEQKHKIINMSDRFGEERVLLARGQIAAAAHKEQEIADCLRRKDTQFDDVLREAMAAYSTKLQQKDADHSAELSRQNAQHLAQMEPHRMEYQDAIAQNQSLFEDHLAHHKREIERLKSKKDDAMRNFDQLSIEATQKDAKFVRLEEELSASKKEIKLLKHQHKMEWEIQKRKHEGALDAVHAKAWEKADKELQEARWKIRDLDDSLMSHQYLSEIAKSEAARAALRATEAESAKTQLEAQLDAKEAELTQSADSIKNLERDLEALRNSNTAKEQVTAQLQKEIVDAAKEMTRKTKEWDSEKKQLSRQQGRYSRGYIAKWTPKAIEASVETAKPQPETATSNDELKQALAETSSLKKQLTTANAALTLSKADISKLNSELEQVNKKNLDLRRADAELMTAKFQLKAESENWKAAYDEKAAALTQTTGSLESAVRKVRDLQQSIARSKAATSEMQKSRDEAQKSNDRYSEDMETATAALKDANDENDALSKKIADLTNGRVERQGDDQVARKEIERLSQQLEEQSKQLGEMSKQLGEKSKQLEEKSKQLEEVSKQLEVKTIDNDANEAALLADLSKNEDLRKGKIAAEAMVQELLTKLDDAAKERELQKKTRGQLNMQQTQNDRLRKEIHALKLRLARACVCKRQPFAPHDNSGPSQDGLGPSEGGAGPSGDDMDIEEGNMESEQTDHPMDDTMDMDASADEAETGVEQVDMTDAGEPEGTTKESDVNDQEMDDVFEDILASENQQQQAALNPANYMSDADLVATLSQSEQQPTGTQNSAQGPPIPLSAYAGLHGLSDAEFGERLSAKRRQEQDMAVREAQTGESSKPRTTSLEQDLGLDIDYESTHASNDASTNASKHAEPGTSGDSKEKGKAPVRDGIPRTRIFSEATPSNNAPLPGLPIQPQASSSPAPAAAAAPALLAPAPLPSWFPRTWNPNFNFTSEYDLSAPGALDDPPAPQSSNPPAGAPSGSSTSPTTQETPPASSTATPEAEASKDEEDTGSDLDPTPEELEEWTADAEAFVAKQKEQEAAKQGDGGDQKDPNALEVIDPCNNSDSDSGTELSWSSSEAARDYHAFQKSLEDSDDEGTGSQKSASAEGDRVKKDAMKSQLFQDMEAIADVRDHLRQQVQHGDEDLSNRLKDEIEAVRKRIREEEVVARQRERTPEEYQQARNRYDSYWREFASRLPAVEAEERMKLGLKQAKVKARPKAVPRSRKRG
ncbi:hypothetical protein MMC30_005762 [Trapelia coarctata]|nr:hypothetical protein [Trapelia coarctata]